MTIAIKECIIQSNESMNGREFGMSAKKQQWRYGTGERVWAGKYLDSQNNLHWHTDCELIYVEEGELDVLCDDAKYKLKTGDAMFFESESLHRIRAVKHDSLLKTIIFDSAIVGDFTDGFKLRSPVVDGAKVNALYDYIFAAFAEKQSLYNQDVESKLRRFTLDLYMAGNKTIVRRRMRSDARLKKLLVEIRENGTHYTLPDAAKFMNMNVSYFSRYFNGKMGMHITRYINSVRVERAIEMIHAGDADMTEICERCSFGSLRNFNRVFKGFTGYTPSELPPDYVLTPLLPLDTCAVDPTLCDTVLVESTSPQSE